MPKKDFTEIICVIDRSGSMEMIREDAIGGFNAFLEDQKEIPGEATMTYTQFDTEYEIIHDNKPLSEVPPLDATTYVPRGATALLDAIGRTMNEVGARLAETPEEERPEKVMFIILTDGEENSSMEFTREQIMEMIKTQEEDYSWEFLYLAADQAGIQAGLDLGIKLDKTMAYTATKAGIKTAYTNLSQRTTAFRNQK